MSDLSDDRTEIRATVYLCLRVMRGKGSQTYKGLEKAKGKMLIGGKDSHVKERVKALMEYHCLQTLLISLQN